jgi:hypothetical protein
VGYECLENPGFGGLRPISQTGESSACRDRCKSGLPEIPQDESESRLCDLRPTKKPDSQNDKKQCS